MTPLVEATIIVRVGPDKSIPLSEAEARALLASLKRLFGEGAPAFSHRSPLQAAARGPTWAPGQTIPPNAVLEVG